MNLDFTNPAVIAGAVVVVGLIAAFIAVILIQRKKRTERLRLRFGPEYDLAVREAGSRSKAEEALQARIRRIEGLNIRELTSVEWDHFVAQWESVQSRFIDHPRAAVTEADELVNALLVSRGYPVGGFEQRVADVSVSHSSLVEPFRLANSITARAGTNEATTEELRTAMIHYRALLDALLGTKTESIDRVALA